MSDSQLIFLTRDLLFSSRVSGTVSRLGGRMITAANGSDVLAALNNSEFTAVVLIDLTAPGIDLAEVVTQIRAARAQKIGVIAYGPHVQEARLDEATAAGCDEVLSRGQFNARMDEVLGRYLTADRK